MRHVDECLGSFGGSSLWYLNKRHRRSGNRNGFYMISNSDWYKVMEFESFFNFIMIQTHISSLYITINHDIMIDKIVIH